MIGPANQYAYIFLHVRQAHPIPQQGMLHVFSTSVIAILRVGTINALSVAQRTDFHPNPVQAGIGLFKYTINKHELLPHNFLGGTRLVV